MKVAMMLEPKKSFLFSAYPALEDKLPYVRLGNHPSPIERLSGLERELSMTTVYMKNEGKVSDIYGGNKIRKLEFLLGAALKAKKEHTLTFGYAGSNHTLAVAIFSRKLGMRPISLHLDQPNARYVRRNLLYQKALGTDLFLFRNMNRITAGSYAIYLWRLLTSGKFPAVIPPGGSSPPGAIGTSGGIHELFYQIKNGELPTPDRIYLPIGSSGTTAGLALGIKALRLKTKLVAVAVTPQRYSGFENIKNIFDGAVILLSHHIPDFPPLTLEEGEIEIRREYLGDGYTRFTPEGMEAVKLLKKTDSLELEGTYTGKAMACLIDDARKGLIKGKTVLFWNTCNAVDFSQKIDGVDWRTLPKEYHHYYEEDFQPLEIRD